MEKGQENPERADGRAFKHYSYEMQCPGAYPEPGNKFAAANSNAKGADGRSWKELYRIKINEMVKAGEIPGDFEDIKKRELQIYHLAEAILIELNELRLILSDKVRVSPEHVPQPIEILSTIASWLQQILVLANATFREAKKGEEISEECRVKLRQVVVHLQSIQLGLDNPQLRGMFQSTLELLEKEIKLL